MRLRHILFVVILAVLLGLAMKAAHAEEWVEAWRSPFGAPEAVAVNPTDGTCWVAAITGVWRVAADGTILGCTGPFQVEGMPVVQRLSANSADGSCWMAGWSPWFAAGLLIHLAANGTELLRLSDLGLVHSVSANPDDGSCWAIVSYYIGTQGYVDVVHLAEDGTELVRVQGFTDARECSVNPTDGSCWVADAGTDQVVHLAQDGAELGRVSGLHASSVSVNPADGSCWVADTGDTPQVVHLAADGAELWRGGYDAVAISVNSADGSCWVAHRGEWNGSEYVNSAIVHLSATGTELWRGGSSLALQSVSANPSDGSCWATAPDQVVHLAADGSQLWQAWSFVAPLAVSASAGDGSCWVADTGSVVHLGEDGTTLLHASASGVPAAVSADPRDGSCWVAENDWPNSTLQVVHLAEDGTTLCQVEGWHSCDTAALSVNATDGSCWVGDTYGCRVAHLAADGTELLNLDDFDVLSLSVNPTDSSCWVGSMDYVIHLAEDGTELLRVGGFDHPYSVSVDPADGSCWVADTNNGQVFHLGSDGTVLWRGGGFHYPSCVSVNPSDGSCWMTEATSHYGPPRTYHFAQDGTVLWQGDVLSNSTPGTQPLSVNAADGTVWIADFGSGQVIHLVGPDWKLSLFPDVPWSHWAFDEVEACYTAGIVAGYDDGLYHPSYPVDRGQMAVYISRALAGGDEYVPEFTATPSFPDVGDTHWALDYVEYAAAQNVVAGYDDGTYHPEYQVTRDQMAVYVARALVAPTGEAALADYVPADPRDFPDVPTDHWAYTHIEYCVENGVVSGYLDGNYHPEGVVTRDQMAVYVARAFGLPL